MKNISINTFSRLEYFERFCKLYDLDFIWQEDKLIITERV